MLVINSFLNTWYCSLLFKIEVEEKLQENNKKKFYWKWHLNTLVQNVSYNKITIHKIIHKTFIELPYLMQEKEES